MKLARGSLTQRVSIGLDGRKSADYRFGSSGGQRKKWMKPDQDSEEILFYFDLKLGKNK